MATTSSTKKIVQATNEPAAKGSGGGTTHQTAPENRAKGNQFRLIAIAFWVVAIVVECFVIFGLLLKKSVQIDPSTPDVNSYPFLGMTLSQNAYFGWIIALIVVCGILSVIGSQFWKKANHLDPASEKDKVRFFVQNQLGAIIAMVAFIPLLILVILDKNLQGAQKGIAIAVAAVVLAGSTVAGAEFNPSSIENQDQQAQNAVLYGQNESNTVDGQGTVWWVAGGTVYHYCQTSQDFSQSDTLYHGSLDQAISAGKTRLAFRNECNVDNTTDKGNPTPLSTP